MLRWVLAAALVASPALAQDRDGTPPKRVRNATVYGDDPCPKAESPDEIVVCGRLGEEERYRIPKEFRDPPSQEAAAQSWVNRTETVMEANRAGLPNSCSPIGTGGLTGCNRQALDQWGAGRRQARRDNAAVP